jgi:hypothetical protein
MAKNTTSAPTDGLEAKLGIFMLHAETGADGSMGGVNEETRKKVDLKAKGK